MRVVTILSPSRLTKRVYTVSRGAVTTRVMERDDSHREEWSLVRSFPVSLITAKQDLAEYLAAGWTRE